MSGERRRTGAWLLPAIVVAVGAYFLITGLRGGTLKPVTLSPVNWIGLAVMAAGLAANVIWHKEPRIRLLGVLACGVGAIMVICL